MDYDDPIFFQEPIPSYVVPVTTSASRRKRDRTAHGKDTTYPPASYTKYAYEMCLQWYEGKSVQFLEATYLRDPLVGSELITNDISARILSKCNESEEFGDLELTYNSKLDIWLNDTVQACIFNSKKLMLDMRPHVPGYPGDDRDKEFRAKMEWWTGAVKPLSKGKARGFRWKNDAAKAAFARDGALCIIWISDSAKVVPLSGFDRQGGQGKVRKVRIEGMEKIPAYIAFAGKVSKAKTKREGRMERSVEALACPLNHPGIIKFFAIHSTSNEAYTLWWNGGHLNDMRHLDRSVVPTIEWNEIQKATRLPEEKQKELSLFRRHKAKLAWALVYVTSLMHKSKVLHNDLSPVNIMLHYPDYSNEIINIGICDWGISSRIGEGAPSHYGSKSELLRDRDRSFRWWVAPELFYAYGPENSDTSISMMQSMHKYTEKSDSYSIGKLTEWMNIGGMVDFDKDIFRDVHGSMYFAMKLRELANPDPKKRPTCIEVTNFLMGAPWYMKPPEAVFRDSPL